MMDRADAAPFQTQEECLSYLVAKRWPHGVTCPRCGNDRIYASKKKPFRWVCKSCTPNNYPFSALSGTIFENTKYPLCEWFQVVMLVCASKEGVSVLEVQRRLGIAHYRTAWFICRRIRAATKDPAFSA